jgi:hypothetical protein
MVILRNLEMGEKASLMIPFQAAHRDEPNELFRGEGFHFSVDPDGQVAVFLANAEAKDLLQVREPDYKVVPFFVVNGFYRTTLILGFFEFTVGVIKDDSLQRHRPV